MPRRLWGAAAFGTLLAGAAVVAVIHDVPAETGPETEAAAAIVFSQVNWSANGFDRPETFSAEIALVFAVQEAVLTVAPHDVGLPTGTTRTLWDLIEAGQGLCYDRSRAIETILELHGMETRHVAVYSTAEAGSALAALMTPGSPSHALSEVRTQRGWLAIDSNVPWVGLAADGGVVSVADLHDQHSVVWDEEVATGPNPFFANDFVIVYGLYSRHGKFYPPFNAIPDYNLRQLMYNVM